MKKNFLILGIIISIMLAGLGSADIFSMWKNVAYTGNSIVDSGTITAEQLTSTDDGTIAGDLTVLGTLSTGANLSDGTFSENISLPTPYTFNAGTGAINFGGLLTTASLKINGTTYSVGALTTNALLKGANIKSNATIYGVGTIKSDALITGANVKSNATIYAVTTLNSGGTGTFNAVVSNTTVTAPADGIRANSVILPGEMVIRIPYAKSDITAGEINQTASFVADDAWTITSIEEAHSPAETTAATMTIAVQKMTGTQTLVQGINVTTAAFSLKSTLNTPVTGTLSTTVGGVGGRTTLADGNRIGIICNMTGVQTAAELRTGCITIHLKRV